MRISDWSSDVCSSDLRRTLRLRDMDADLDPGGAQVVAAFGVVFEQKGHRASADARAAHADVNLFVEQDRQLVIERGAGDVALGAAVVRSEETTSEIQSLMSISYDVFVLNKTKIQYSKSIYK